MCSGFLFPYKPEEKWQKKEEPQRFACLDDCELDELVEGAQANDKILKKKIRSKHFSSKLLHKDSYIKIPFKIFFIRKKNYT